MNFIIFGRWCSCNCYAVMLLYTFSICSTVLTCASSCKNTPTAKEIAQEQCYHRIPNLYTYIPYCLFLTLYTLTLLYMHILHIFFFVFWRGEFAQQSRAFFLLIIISPILMTLMFNEGMILWGEISSKLLFGVWVVEWVNVQMIENLVCLAFFLLANKVLVK